MSADAFVGHLVNLGTGGAVIIALVHFWRMKDQSDKMLLDRIDKIVDRHLESERLGREQIQEIAAQNRAMFDKVIDICGDLSEAVKELRIETNRTGKFMEKLSETSSENRKEIDLLRNQIQELMKEKSRTPTEPGSVSST